MTATIPNDWWKHYFDEDFLRIYREVLDPEEPAIVADSLRVVMGLAPGARVLDLACGWGRHSHALAEAGLDVVGLDRSTTLLAEAASGSIGGGQRWICADLRDLPLRDGTFEAVVCLFSSLGYFPSDEDDVRVLREAARLLVPGGRLLIETVHRDAAVRDYLERDWWSAVSGERVLIEREFDPVAGVTRETLHWIRPDGSTGEKQHTARIRTATEWQELLARAGLQAIGWYGGWDLEPFDYRSEMLVLLAEPDEEAPVRVR